MAAYNPATDSVASAQAAPAPSTKDFPDDPERANSVKERMKRFSSLSNTPKCATCERSVYANDPQVVLDGLSYHRACAKCMECKCQITIQNFTKSGTTLYCKTHYIKKFKEEGTILGSEKFTHQSAPGKFAGSGFTIQRSDSSVAAAPAEPAAAAPAPEPIQKPSAEPTPEPAPEAVPEPIQEPVAVPAAAPEPTPEPEVVSESDVKLEESNTEEVVEAPVEAETPSEPATAPADEEEEKAEAPVATETEDQEQSDAKAESAEQETPAVDVDVPAASPAGQEGEEESEGV